MQMLELIWHGLIKQYRKGFSLLIAGPLASTPTVIREFASDLVGPLAGLEVSAIYVARSAFDCRPDKEAS